MKFYHTINPEGFVELVDTQQQSKAAGVKTPKVFEVPTDKDGLRNFVNELYRKIGDPLTLPHTDPTPTVGDGGNGDVARKILAEMDAGTKPKEKVPLDREQVEDYILDCEKSNFHNIFLVFCERLERFKRDSLSALGAD